MLKEGDHDVPAMRMGGSFASAESKHSLGLLSAYGSGPLWWTMTNQIILSNYVRSVNIFDKARYLTMVLVEVVSGLFDPLFCAVSG
jgi:hypothetical protein